VSFANPKSSTLTVAVRAHFHVRGFEIPMHDALFVGGFQRVGNLSRDRQRVRHRNRAARDEDGQVVAGHEFHDQRATARVRRWVLDAVDLRDVRMIQRRQRPRLAFESREPVGIAVKEPGSNLSATSRPSFVSRARYTSPMPPSPSLPRIW
jgi:hypothetical protein